MILLLNSDYVIYKVDTKPVSSMLKLALKEISSQQIQQPNAPKVFVNNIVSMSSYTFL